MDLPIGYDNFAKVIENKLDFVDKSVWIKELIDDRTTEVAVITRPRRFGKTLNLSMLHHFLAPNVYGKSTTSLFDNLKIMHAGEYYAKQQGKYPAIFVTFKDIKDSTYAMAYQNLAQIMSELYAEHRYLLDSSKLFEEDKINFETLLKQQANETLLKSSLKNLTRYLALHHGVSPWLLIDEYNTPIQSAYLHGYYDNMMHLLRSLLGSVLKTNPYLYKAVITGILRVAKESLFSGVNNLEVYSLMRSEYGSSFGFTESEMDTLLKQAHLEKQAAQIKDWYNGYQAGDIVVYNPWSIVNCIKRKGELAPYWVNTSDNQLIRNLLVRSSTAFKEQFEILLQGQTIERLIDENTVFGDLQKNETAAWSLLFMAGYLKVVTQQRTDDGLQCVLAIPNREVRNLYQQIIKQWLANGHGIEWYNSFLNHLLTGNLEAFERELTEVMEQTVSHHDTSRDPETFYHGLMVGITASLYQSPHYEVQSNKESGYGRYDYMIFSRDKTKPTLLMEFKKVKAEADTEKLAVHLAQAAQEALTQIDALNYAADAKQRGSTHLLKIGLAFSGKRFKLAFAEVK